MIAMMIYQLSEPAINSKLTRTTFNYAYSLYTPPHYHADSLNQQESEVHTLSLSLTPVLYVFKSQVHYSCPF